jgi:TDG/mug DNA glycosylase family protein
MERSTVAVYEAQAREWRSRRPARLADAAAAFAGKIPAGRPRVDAGCGPGSYFAQLGSPILGLDAAFAMLELARETAADAWLAQADLEGLPVRRGALYGAWARASYLHVPRTRLPWALAELHDALAVGGPLQLTMRQGEHEGAIPHDDFPGRFFAEWRADALADVVIGAGFTIDDLTGEDTERGEWLHVRATRAHTLPDYVDAGMRLLVVGLNPSEYAADAGVGFARPGNRFWPAALAAGLVSIDRDPRHALQHHGLGMSDLVKRATPSAAALTTAEYRAGTARIERLVTWLRPGAVCFVGLAGWRAAVDRHAEPGPQPQAFGGVSVYVMPNTSGANAHTSMDGFVEHLEAAKQLADRAVRPS